MQNKKDSQNQYRTGVLVANHVEDRFGHSLLDKQDNWQFPKSEVKSRFDLGSSMLGYGRHNFPQKPVTENQITADIEEKTHTRLTGQTKDGQPGHILMGHGANQDTFEKRDFGTTNELFYNKKMRTETLINPHYYHNNKDNKNCKQILFNI